MIEVEQLSKIYGSIAAIQDVTFSVESGEILGFLGPNGAGKTTTMRILSGYLPASGGTARVAGHDVHEESMSVRQRIGYLPENPPLYPDMTVEEFLYFVARIKRVSAGDRAERVKAAIDRCNLTDKQQTLIRKLSKGFRQRVGIAQAIVHDPPVIILDEPTIGLDPRQIIDVRNLIKSLAGQHTVILSTHILPEVSMTCSRVAIINRGQVVATNTPDELVRQLEGGWRYDLEVAGAPDSVQSALGNVPGVTAVAMTAPSDDGSDRHWFQLDLAPNSDPGQAIAAAVVQSGFGLYEMRRSRASLEDVFLQLTMTETSTPDIADGDASEADYEDTSESLTDEVEPFDAVKQKPGLSAMFSRFRSKPAPLADAAPDDSDESDENHG